MGLSAIGSGAGREQDVSVSAGANSETVDSAPLASPKRLIGALGNLGRAARAAFPATGARRPQFACASSSGDDKLPAQGFFPGIGDEQIRKTEEEGGEVQAHQLAVLPEEQNSRLNREARGEPAAQAARWLAPDVPQVDGRAAMGAAYISLRGRDEPAGPQPSIPAVSYGDRDSFPDEAQAAGDKAVGRIDPQANFSVRRPLLSSLAAAFRLNREQAPDAGHRPRPMLRPRLA